MNKEESDLIIAEQNKSTEEILKAVAKVKSDYKELCNLKDMRIAKLGEENKVLAQNLEDTEILNKTYEKRFSDLEKENAELKKTYRKQRNKRIDELQKENAELKEKLEVVIALKNEEMGCIETDFNTFKSKAKEIIKEFMKYEINEYDGSLEIHFEELKKQAEQFLNSEVKK